MASSNWQPGSFQVMTPNGPEHAEGLIGGPFGIRQEPRRWRPVWTVSHLATGLRVTPGNGAGFIDPALAQEFANRLLPLADWSTGRALADNRALAEQVVAIWNELIMRDVAAVNAQSYAMLSRSQEAGRTARRRKR